MCGIIGVVGNTDVATALMHGLMRLEYRGYDSAGLALVDESGNKPARRRCIGRVSELQQSLEDQPLSGCTGIAHTRWATHGIASERNTHPFVSSGVALAHNGIIENFAALKADQADGYEFESKTDSEVIVHLVHHWLASHKGCLLEAVAEVVKLLEGAFALVVISQDEPHRLVAARSGSPLVLGLAKDRQFVASDSQALSGMAEQVIFLQEGELAELSPSAVKIIDAEGCAVARTPLTLTAEADPYSLGQHQHYMIQEIYSQPDSIRATLSGRIEQDQVPAGAFGEDADKQLDRVKAVTLVGCGSSYLAACVGRYWLEQLAGLPCQVEIASEYRYREPVVMQDSLFVSLSQSGETADTLAALKLAQTRGYLATLAICNVALSNLDRLSVMRFLLAAGTEISVASTKAVSSMLVALMMLAILLGRKNGRVNRRLEAELVGALRALPAQITKLWQQEAEIEQHARRLVTCDRMLFVGRGALYPIALEGALKMKELSYIHAEGHAAGELKHGPLALVDEQTPVIALATKGALLGKMQSNLQEIAARKGRLLVLTDQSVSQAIQTALDCETIALPDSHPLLTPVVYLPPLQLLAYHTALARGNPIDNPRNLAKSVTVE